MQSNLFVRAAIESLRGNKLRSFLTMLGIVIGIAAIVIIIAVGNGAQSLIVNQINTLGSDLIGVLPGGSDEKGPPATAMGVTITSLKYSDAEAIKKQVPGLQAVSAYVKGVGTISWNDKNVDSNFTGVDPDYFIVEHPDLDAGYQFTEEDNNSLNRVVILGSQTFEDLFGSQSPQNALGQTIRIRRQAFRVIGVMKKRGTVAFQSQDDQVFIPTLTAQKLLLGIDYLGFIRAKLAPGQDVDTIAEEIRAVLRERHGIQLAVNDDFSVRSTAQALDVLGTITDVLKYFLAAVSALSLLVGGIGIMNIMLVAVLERTAEIGLRKAVGARPYHLRIQFLYETIIICLLGGIIGLIIGIIVSWLIATVAQSLGYAWDFRIGVVPFLLAIGFPIFIGLIFGYYPAQQAARLRPIEALHYE